MQTYKKPFDKRLKESVEFIKHKIKIYPKIALILGSGLGDFADSLPTIKIMNTTKIPNYPHSTVEGHKGKLIFCKLNEIPLLVFQGRHHFYETGDIETVLYPIHVASALGIEILIITNAAGGVNRKFRPGDLMLIKDQINLTFENPLYNLSRSIIRIPLYDLNLQKLILTVSSKKDISLKEGVYCGIKGPSYETAAEIKMIRKFGADAVGMSTVNEVSLAATLGMRVLGISCITNMSTGISKQKLSHEEVTDVAKKVKYKFLELIRGFIKSIEVNS